MPTISAFRISSPTSALVCASICRSVPSRSIMAFRSNWITTPAAARSSSASAINFERKVALAVKRHPNYQSHPTFMKKLILAVVLSAFALPGGAFAQGMKIGTIDMNRAFKEYNKTKDAEKKINDAKDAAKKEYDDRADTYKKALDEINKLNQQLVAPALSADAKTQKAKERVEKIASIKNLEREINDFRQTREKQLQEQAVRMRDGIVKEITAVVMERVKANNLDLVFDKSGMSLN